MSNMSIVQGGTTVNLSIIQDSHWREPVQLTEHIFIGASDGASTIQWGSTGSAIRELGGYIMSFADLANLQAIYKSKTTAVFTGDQAGDTSTVVIKEFQPDRVYDVRNFERVRVKITLMKRS